MRINSEQEMLDYGTKFADFLVKSPSWTGDGPEGEHPLSVSEVGEEKAQQDPSKTKVIELIGDVGAGKTTFVRGLAKGLGITKPITSPSFTISKSYALPQGGNLIHYDFYRLPNPGLMSNELAEALQNPNNIILIEWGESVEDLLPRDHTIILLNKNDDNSRTVSIQKNQNNTIRDHIQLTKSEISEASPITTNEHEQVEKGAVRLFLDTSTPETVLMINNNEYRYNFGHDLAEKLLQFIHDKLEENNYTWQDITEITYMSGPGSFTGLRIGATIVNTLAHELHIPLRDHHGTIHDQIIPEYDRPANISQPRK